MPTRSAADGDQVVEPQAPPGATVPAGGDGGGCRGARICGSGGPARPTPSTFPEPTTGAAASQAQVRHAVLAAAESRGPHASRRAATEDYGALEFFGTRARGIRTTDLAKAAEASGN